MPKKTVLKTRADLARKFGKSERVISTWLGEGMPGAPGAYVWEDCAEWVANRGDKRKGVKVAEADDMDASGDTSEWLEEYRKWRAKQEELKYAVKRGELVELESVRDFLQQLAGRFRSFGERLEKASPEMRTELDAILEQGKQEVEGLGIARSGDGESC